LDGPERLAFEDVEAKYFRPALRFNPTNPRNLLAMAVALQSAYTFMEDEAPQSSAGKPSTPGAGGAPQSPTAAGPPKSPAGRKEKKAWELMNHMAMKRSVGGARGPMAGRL
jgi:hypothetical protein